MATKGIRIPIMWKSDPRGLTDAEKRMQKFGKAAQIAGGVAAAGLAVAGAAALKFGADSVRAFAEAQEAQNRLAFAFEKFPALADTNVEAIRRLNSALMQKTRFDDDAIASAQGVLAQFDLTGDQLSRLTPLLLDYAAATGKDLTTSAEDLGRAMMGQGRALKVLGIDFEDTGTIAGNFDQLIQDLSSSVGGFAEKDATTAAGQLQILQNRFGEVQEAVGEALLPALQKLIDWIDGEGLVILEDFAAWFAEDGVVALTTFIDKIAEMAENGTLVPNIVAGIGAITAAQLGLNAAMAANPVGLVIAGLGLLAAAATFVITNWNDVSKVVFRTTGGIVKAAIGMVTGVAGAVQGIINAILPGLNVLVRPINMILAILGQPQILLPSSVNFMSRVSAVSSQLGQMIDAGALGGLNYLSNGYGGTGGSGRPATPGGMTAFADGGVVMPRAGGIHGIIGEAGEAEAVMPLSWLEGQLGGGGGNVYNITVNAGMGADGAAVGREIVAAIKRYERTSGPVFASA